MADSRSFERGVVAGILLMLGADAGYWFVTPAAHPAATLAQTVGVWAQLIAGLGGGGWMLWRARRADHHAQAPAAAPVGSR